MIVICGWRTMGKVDEVENQYALTKFFHLFWLPIVPSGSVWILDHASGSGHAIKMHGKSIFAAYVRWWGSIIGGLCALGAIQTANIALGVVATALLALVVASWRWSRPVPSSATDELAGLIAARITAELAGDKFTPRPTPTLGLTIDLVLRRDGLRKNFVVTSW